jgi:O-antigen/teichoic acid export membrane protein
MSTKKNQIINTSLYIVPVVVGNLLPILTLPIFTRILTVEDYGIFALSQVYAIFVNGISNFGLSIGYERNFFESDDSYKRAGLLFATLLFVTCTFSFFWGLTFFYKEALAQWVIGDKKHAYILFWSYGATGIASLKTYFLIYFKNSENAKAFIWYTIDESLIGVMLSLIMIVYFRTGVYGLIWGPLIASSLIFIILAIHFLRMLPFVLDIQSLKSSLKLSLPLTPRIFFGVIGNQFDKYMIGLLGTIGAVGIYNLGQKFAYIQFTFMTALQNTFAPQVYKRFFELSEEDGGLSVGNYLTPYFYLSIAGGLLVSLFSEEAIILLTPKSYHGAIDIACIIAMLYSTYFFGKQPQLLFKKRTGLISMLTIFGIGLNIVINIPFINKWGVIGAAWGTFLAGVISTSISFFVSQKYYKIKWEYFKLIVIMGLYFIITLGAMGLRDYDIMYEYRLIFKLAGIGLFLLLGSKMKIFSLKDLSLLVNSMRPLN